MSDANDVERVALVGDALQTAWEEMVQTMPDLPPIILRECEREGLARAAIAAMGGWRDIASALAKVDAVDKACPFKQTRAPSSDEDCKLCGGTSGTGCWRAHNAAHDFVAAVRASLPPPPEPSS